MIGDVYKADWSQASTMDWDQRKIGANTETGAETEPEQKGWAPHQVLDRPSHGVEERMDGERIIQGLC